MQVILVFVVLNMFHRWDCFYFMSYANWSKNEEMNLKTFGEEGAMIQSTKDFIESFAKQEHQCCSTFELWM